MPHFSKWQSLPTEAINPATLAIDKQPAAGIVDLMLAEEKKALAAVYRERDRIAVGADMLAKALRKGGRIIFVGAGTSGRLGVVESAEMPPTFGTDPAVVQAIIAGGKTALLRAKEGAEDDYEEGARAARAARSDAQGRRRRRVGQRHDALRARRADHRAAGRRAHHLRHLRPAHRAPELRRSRPSRPPSGPR